MNTTDPPTNMPQIAAHDAYEASTPRPWKIDNSLGIWSQAYMVYVGKVNMGVLYKHRKEAAANAALIVAAVNSYENVESLRALCEEQRLALRANAERIATAEARSEELYTALSDLVRMPSPHQPEYELAKRALEKTESPMSKSIRYAIEARKAKERIVALEKVLQDAMPMIDRLGTPQGYPDAEASLIAMLGARADLVSWASQYARDALEEAGEVAP